MNIITFFPVDKWLPEREVPILIWTKDNRILNGRFNSYFHTQDGFYIRTEDIIGWAYNGG